MPLDIPTIVKILSDGEVLELSDGRRHVVLTEDRAIARKWRVGDSVIVTSKAKPPNSFELRSASRLTEFVQTLRA